MLTSGHPGDRRIADLLYHAAVSADNDIHGDYGAVVSVPGKLLM